jgi:hypothetical protein
MRPACLEGTAVLTATVNTMVAASSQTVSGTVRPNRLRTPLTSIVASMVVVLSLGGPPGSGAFGICDRCRMRIRMEIPAGWFYDGGHNMGRTEAVISLLGLPVHPGGRARCALARAA